MSFKRCYDLVIVVFGCDTKNKYRNQILKIQQTYGKVIDEYDNIEMLFFLGKKTASSLKGEKFIHLDDVDDSYSSAGFKQWHGLKYVYENLNTKFVMCFGTDTYINVKKLDIFLKKFNHNDNLYIGGHGHHRNINNKSIYYHDGGAGVILSKVCLEKIYVKISNVNNFMTEWRNMYFHGWSALKDACDVAIGYLAQTSEINAQIIKENNHFFQCSYKGGSCHRSGINMKNIISCHTMSLTNFDDFTKILIDNNYYI